jgi:hypothetical protein
VNILESTTPKPSPGFPDADALCERCGYRLHGLPSPPESSCPECGLPIADSSPIHRPGLAWQSRVRFAAWFATAWAMFAHPRRGFRALRIGGRNWRDRLFLLIVAVLISAYWAAVWRVASPMLKHAWAWGLGAGATVIVLTYIEAAGVTYFGRRRGWRMTLALSERICCYAAVGWMPAAVIFIKAWMLKEYYLSETAWWQALHQRWAYNVDAAYLIALGAVGSLWFETLAWLGVRTAKYANAPAISPG